MKILSIETSCDETALALLEITDGEYENTPNVKIINTSLYSQVEKHREYGGVFPSLAKREHALNLVPLLESLLIDESGADGFINTTNTGNAGNNEKLPEIEKILEREPKLYENFVKTVTKLPRPEVDRVAVTSGPGLEPALWVGINFAKALSLYWDIPVIPINHMEGHIVSVLTADLTAGNGEGVSFPAVALLISGGHTELVEVKKWGEYKILGATKDDAVGEAFDKVARILGLHYPGGPEISKLAAAARDKQAKTADRPDNMSGESFNLPRPMLHSGNLDFSFSGLKTAVLYLVKNLKKEHSLSDDETLSESLTQQIALEFENAVTEVLLSKTKRALEEINAKTLIIGGGVIANKHIRETFLQLEAGDGGNSDDKSNGDRIRVMLPEKELSTDNAVMIGVAGFFKDKTPAEAPEIRANGSLKLS